MAADSAEEQKETMTASQKAEWQMMIAWLIAEKIVTDWFVIDSAAAAVAEYGIAWVCEGYFPAGSSALKAFVAIAAGAYTAADSATVVAAAVEQPVAFLAFAADYL